MEGSSLNNCDGIDIEEVCREELFETQLYSDKVAKGGLVLEASQPARRLGEIFEESS